MLCHDQDIDRRILAQAGSLIENGHTVTLLALSKDGKASSESNPNGLTIVRIGLHEIIPENSIYKGYLHRNDRLLAVFNQLSKINSLSVLARLLYTGGIKGNWFIYKLLLKCYYRGSNIDDPLPFRSSFFRAGESIDADVIHVHDLPALQAGAELATEKQAHFVYDAHELYPEQKAFSKKQRLICSKNESTFIKQANLVFTVNDSIAEEMAVRYSINKPKVLLNALDPDPSFDPTAEYDLLRQKLNLSPRKRILLFQGGFSPNRNLDKLVKAMRYVADQHVVLVMLGFGSYRDTLEKVAQRNNYLGSRVYFLDAVPQSELVQHSASADVGIIPYPHVDLNSYFCTPNKLFEFIQAGLPILANDSPELRRFVVDNGFGMVRSMKTAKEIGKAIDTVFSASGASLGQWRQALKTQRSDLTWSKESHQYLRVYSKLLATSNT